MLNFWIIGLSQISLKERHLLSLGKFS